MASSALNAYLLVYWLHITYKFTEITIMSVELHSVHYEVFFYKPNIDFFNIFIPEILLLHIAIPNTWKCI